MSLFGEGRHDESPSLHSDSDADEIQEIPESSEQEEEEQYDDMDDIYSDDDDDEDSDDDATTPHKQPLTEKEKTAFRRRNRNEIHVLDAFETTRAGDLGRNLLGAASERHFLVSKQPVECVASWAARARWTGDEGARRAVPAPYWTAWPLRLGEVPLSGERFCGLRGGDGDEEGFWGKRRRVGKASAEFEEVLCDFAARKARERVGGKSRVGKVDEAEREGVESSSSGEEASDSDSTEPEQQNQSSAENETSTHEESTPAFSADQDRTRDILQPTIRSIMSKVDALMTGLYHSRMNHRNHRSASHDANSIPSHQKCGSSPEGEKKEALGLRDWSEILGMASLTGWDPKVVRRAAERCSRLFGEGMAFADLDDGGVSTKVCTYSPHVVPRFEEGEGEGWSLDTLLCPHEDCARHTRRFDLRRRLRWHIKDVHDWDPQVERRPVEIVGGVHRDGFLRPIAAQPGWRARDKVKSERRGGKRKREGGKDVDG
ncbi:hypothetical protein Vi05172_g4931 [Venturia inaequalis]|nr:hypothetical protein Vi05172_g4931 [Venturia inaequalis]